MNNDELLNCKAIVNPNVYYMGRVWNKEKKEYEIVSKGEFGYISWKGDC